MAGSLSFSAGQTTKVRLQDIRGGEDTKSLSEVRARRKDKKQSKKFEIPLTELLFSFNVTNMTSDRIYHYEREFESECEDDLLEELEEDRGHEDPCALDFIDRKYGKVCRRRRNLPNPVLNSRKYPRNKSYQAIVDKVDYVKNDSKVLICYSKKELKELKIPLLKRYLRKIGRKTSELEAKKNNVEKRLMIKNTPRRGPVNNISQTSFHPQVQASSKPNKSRNLYDHNQFVLTNDNAKGFGGESFLSSLIDIQERDITPEDFDLLLQLDSYVKIKTVSISVINELKTEKVGRKMKHPCMICMEEYEMGEILKYLKCGHFFHSSCIMTWLTLNSNKCPLDDQEVS